jgi:hypothetical protein
VLGSAVLKEGDEVAPGIVLVRIGANASWIEAGGERWELRHGR